MILTHTSQPERDVWVLWLAPCSYRTFTAIILQFQGRALLSRPLARAYTHLALIDFARGMILEKRLVRQLRNTFRRTPAVLLFETSIKRKHIAVHFFDAPDRRGERLARKHASAPIRRGREDLDSDKERDHLFPAFVRA